MDNTQQCSSCCKYYIYDNSFLFRKEGTYEKGCEDRQTQKSKNIKESVKNDVEKEQSEMSKAAAELLQSFDMSQSQERHLEKPASLRLRESLDDELSYLSGSKSNSKRHSSKPVTPMKRSQVTLPQKVHPVRTHLRVNHHLNCSSGSQLVVL